MSDINRTSLPVAVLMGVFFFAIYLVVTQDDRAFAGPKSSITKWEYDVADSNPTTLPTKLRELGAAGWEVFSIERASQVFEQDAEKKSHLVVERYQIVSRRPVQGEP